MTKYQNMIDVELPGMLDHFKYLRQELYVEVSHLCLRMFSIGIYARAKAPPGTVAVAINDVIRTEKPITENEHRMAYQIGVRFFLLGQRIKETDDGQLLLRATESIEYVSERLGCKDYCAQAVSHFLTTDAKSKSN